MRRPITTGTDPEDGESEAAIQPVVWPRATAGGAWKTSRSSWPHVLDRLLHGMYLSGRADSRPKIASDRLGYDALMPVSHPAMAEVPLTVLSFLARQAAVEVDVFPAARHAHPDPRLLAARHDRVAGRIELLHEPHVGHDRHVVAEHLHDR